MIITRKARYMALFVVAAACCASPLAKAVAAIGIVLCLFL